MLHVCAKKFDVMGETFLGGELNKAIELEKG